MCKHVFFFFHLFPLYLLDESKVNTARSKDEASDLERETGTRNNQQQDWSILWSCFENPLSLLSMTSGLPKGMKEMVSNAVSEMRRYYSRKVADVLIKIIRASLDMLQKRFTVDENDRNVSSYKVKNHMTPVFLIHSKLMIPNIVIRPTLDELQEALIIAGRNITSVAKGVAQWASEKEVVSYVCLFIFKNSIFGK